MLQIGLLLVTLLIAAPTCCAASCVVLASGVSFGAYSTVSSNPNDSTSTVIVTCTATLIGFVSFNIELGSSADGNYTPRRLTSGSHNLNYNLFMNSARTTIWGNGSGGTTLQSYSSSLPIGVTVVNYNVYGRIFPGQNVPGGVYADSIVVSVNY